MTRGEGGRRRGWKRTKHTSGKNPIHALKLLHPAKAEKCPQKAVYFVKAHNHEISYPKI